VPIFCEFLGVRIAPNSVPDAEVASIEPPKERKRLLGPGDNLPGAFRFVELDDLMRLSG